MSMFSLILPGRDPTSTPFLVANEAMSSTPSDLQHLRRRLDEIDDRLQDLLIDRANIVSMVAASKKGGNQPAFQPAREAEIIRRLVGRHHGTFPVASLVRMWREMLAATVRLQSPFSIGVFAPPERQGYWDLARDHYGSNTPMTAYHAVDQVISAVAGTQISLGVLPIPETGEADPWWPKLLSITEDGLQVIARLPFGACGNARAGGAEALVIGRGPPQESGLDRTLVVAEWVAEITRAQISNFLAAAGLACTWVLSCRREFALNLIEIEGFVPMSDSRLNAFRVGLGPALRRLMPLGGYATPLSPASLAAKG
jgi:chorismate mutase / prephenate dehydratase